MSSDNSVERNSGVEGQQKINQLLVILTNLRNQPSTTEDFAEDAFMKADLFRHLETAGILHYLPQPSKKELDQQTEETVQKEGHRELIIYDPLVALKNLYYGAFIGRFFGDHMFPEGMFRADLNYFVLFVEFHDPQTPKNTENKLIDIGILNELEEIGILPLQDLERERTLKQIRVGSIMGHVVRDLKLKQINPPG
jgi:hypothetical protein